MVIVSVPIHVTEQIIAKLPPLPEDCILVDLASVKMVLYRQCWRRTPGPCLVTPDVWPGQRQPGEAGSGLLRRSSAGSVSVVPGTDSGLGARLHRISAVEHDQNMAFIQALRHFATFAYGLHGGRERSA